MDMKMVLKALKNRNLLWSTQKNLNSQKYDKNWSDPQWVKLPKKYLLQAKTVFQQWALILYCLI